VFRANDRGQTGALVMSERIKPTGSNCRILTGLLGALVLIAIVELFLTRNDADSRSTIATVWRWKSHEGVRAARDAEILCLGDSLVHQGLVPRVIEIDGGPKTFNLAVPGGTMPSSFFMLRKALESGAKPAAVLVDGENLSGDPFVQTAHWLELTSFAERVEFIRTTRRFEIIARWSLESCLASVRNQATIRHRVIGTCKGLSSSSRWSEKLAIRNMQINKGAYLVEKSLASTAALNNYVSTPGSAGFRLDPINELYAERLLTLAASRGIAVRWLLPPMHPELERCRERDSWGKEHFAYLRRLQSRYPNLTIIDGRGGQFGPELLADLTHLNARGAVVCSQAIRESLRSVPSASVAVLRFDLNQVQNHLAEDLLESKQALGAIYRQSLAGRRTSARSLR
jgi:hypothetical protein